MIALLRLRKYKSRANVIRELQWFGNLERVPMFFSFVQRAIAFSMPFVFLCAWVSCIAICSEIVGHSEEMPDGAVVESSVLDTFDEGCSLTTTAALLQETKLIQHALSVNSQNHIAPRPRSIHSFRDVHRQPRVRSRSPVSSPSLYLQFHSFRI